MISIEASTRTCKVDTASAARIESDRFLNPLNVVCPTWTGRDLSGRQVNADSFYTKRAGCNSAEDRVIVENALRPQYSEYINLDVNEGIRGNLYENNSYFQQSGVRTKGLKNLRKVTGSFGGVVSGAEREFDCRGSNKNYDAMENGVHQMERQVAENNRRGVPQGCKSRHFIPATPNQPRKRHNHHGGQVVEGFTDDRMVVASNDIYRKNAAALSGYRSCKFTEASGF
jgi:hypothetical protein